MIHSNAITGEPLIIESERARRPNIFRDEDEVCPFCAGNEALTPPEIARAGEPWQVRVFPNKYPATGFHEVVVESPRHDDTFDRIPGADAAVRMYVERYHALRGQTGHVTIFKNNGAMAGASIPHLHSQIIGTPFTPPRVAREAAALRRSCALCSLAEEPLIRETANYRWIAPKGSMFAYEQWIVPKEHAPEIREPHELWELLQSSVRAMKRLAHSYNWIFMNFPHEPRAHWYVQLFPRFAVHAGFELASGSAINTVDPTEAARVYRQDCE